MLVVLQAEHMRQSVDRIMGDEELDREEKYEALCALRALNPKEAEKAIEAARSGRLRLAVHPSLFGLDTATLGQKAPH